MTKKTEKRVWVWARARRREREETVVSPLEATATTTVSRIDNDNYIFTVALMYRSRILSNERRNQGVAHNYIGGGFFFFFC